MIDNDDLFAPWGEMAMFGNPWHGSESAGTLRRPDGALMALQPCMQYQRAPDGGHRLINFGMPAVSSSEEELALGMTWSNIAILAGSGMQNMEPVRYYNRMRGESSPSVSIRRIAWPYRCADGTVYLLWFQGKRIRCKLIDEPASILPSNADYSTAAERLNLTGIVVDSVDDVSGLNTYYTMQYVNAAPNGTAAAIHNVYMRATTGPIVMHQIVELSVTGGSISALPTIAVSRNRAGSALQTSTQQLPAEISEKKMTRRASSTTVLVDSTDPAQRRIRYYEVWVNSGVNSTDPTHLTTNNGLQRGVTTTVVAVTYDVSSARVELGYVSDGQKIWEGSITQPGWTIDYVADGNGVYISGTKIVKTLDYLENRTEISRTYLTRNGVMVGDYISESRIDGISNHIERWIGKTVPQVLSGGVQSSKGGWGSVSLIYGDTAIVTNPAIDFDSGLTPIAGNYSYFGHATGAGGSMSLTQVATFTSIREFAANPMTGAFTAGVTRYF